MHLVQMIPSLNKYCYGWIYGVQLSHINTIPQDQDLFLNGKGMKCSHETSLE